MPEAARISDHHLCPKVEPGPVPHVGGPIFSGSANVIVGNLPAARVGDRLVCIPVGPTDKIESGSSNVIINGKSAARKTDPCTHIKGSMIVRGCPTVIIGETPQSSTFKAAARRGTPFCEECERRRREMDDHDDSADVAADPDTATLDDEAPPPGALAGRDLLSTSNMPDAGMRVLASQPDQEDGLDLERRKARLAVAYQFYAAHTLIDGKVKPSKISAHLEGLDPSKPVEVIGVSGKTFYQRGRPGGGDGEYVALDPNVPPSELGVSEEVYPVVDDELVEPAVPRDRRVLSFGDAPAYGLKSTAAKYRDRHSMPETAKTRGKAVDCVGGATQVMIPKTFHVSCKSTTL